MLHVTWADGYFALDRSSCATLGGLLAPAYQSAEPFPHAVIDGLFDGAILAKVAADFPSSDGHQYFDRDQERLKFQFNPLEVDSGITRNLFAELNGQAFVAFLEELTGIRGLIPDPHFDGGGLHETKPGGHLGVHADFNIHGKLNVQRRLNLLIYLNSDWSEEFGGDLELWDRDMKSCVVKIAPLFGRAVIFSTDLDSFHGHPEPLMCPSDRSRRSIATYYYSAPREGIASLPRRTTNFQPRPISGDSRDWQIRRHHFVNDWIPPRLQRLAHRLIG